MWSLVHKVSIRPTLQQWGFTEWDEKAWGIAVTTLAHWGDSWRNNAVKQSRKTARKSVQISAVGRPRLMWWSQVKALRCLRQRGKKINGFVDTPSLIPAARRWSARGSRRIKIITWNTFVELNLKHHNIIISIHCWRDANRLNGMLASTKLSHRVLIKQYNFPGSLSLSLSLPPSLARSRSLGNGAVCSPVICHRQNETQQLQQNRDAAGIPRAPWIDNALPSHSFILSKRMHQRPNINSPRHMEAYASGILGMAFWMIKETHKGFGAALWTFAGVVWTLHLFPTLQETWC